MMSGDRTDVRYVPADHALRARIAAEWGEKAARHMHLDDGFSIVALAEGELAGLISVYWQDLPSPLGGTREAYIDIIEVPTDYRRKGIAREMIALAEERACEQGAYQMRAWSSEDKAPALQMWRSLGWALCPAITHPGGREVRGFFVTGVL
jgi:GNAT superfamily N-acetyltransferase